MKLSKICLIMFFSLGICGCWKCSTKDLEEFEKPYEADVTAEEYQLQPADEITISATRVPELHEKTQVIRPDGKVSFETIGDVPVAGKTPRQVAKLLADIISNIYTLPNENAIDVQVTDFQSKLYYIVGHVSFPGAKIFTGRETTLSAIAKAVPTVSAWEERIQLVRPSDGKEVKAKICGVDFHQMVKYGDMRYNVLLEEGDIIYVPPTIFAAIGLTVSELVSPIVSGAGAITAVSGAAAPADGGL